MNAAGVTSAFGGTSSDGGRAGTGSGGDVLGGGAGSSSSGAGTGGSGGTAGTTATAPTDYCSTRPGLAFCETFEQQPTGTTVATAPWTPSINGDGTVEIDGGVSHSGKQSLKVHGSGFSTFLVLDVAPSFNVADTPLHVRAYVRLAEPMTGGHNTFVVADLKSAPGTGNAFRLGEMNAMLMYTVSGDTHGALANDNFYTDHLPGAALEAAKWNCVELVLDHQKPEIAVALAGAPIADLHHTDWPLDAYDSLRFGFEKYAGPVTDVWYDDIAIGSAPLGCDP